MNLLPKAITDVIDSFAKLPGVGKRTAERLTFHLIRMDRQHSSILSEALDNLHKGIKYCTTCFNLAEDELCQICRSPKRDRSILAVVEEPLDVIALENTGEFRGVYHVLGGVISPIDGIGPEQLNISKLVDRVADSDIEEIIIATNPSIEGESTALYIQKKLKAHDIKITRLARGLPVGIDLEYADQITLSRALEGRQNL